MNIRQLAIELYNECLDIDFLDYEDTKEKDILFLESLIQEIGEDNTRKYIAEFLER